MATIKEELIWFPPPLWDYGESNDQFDETLEAFTVADNGLGKSITAYAKSSWLGWVEIGIECYPHNLCSANPSQGGDGAWAKPAKRE